MIRVSRLADYGVLLMARFAAGEGGPQPASELARRTGLPEPTVGKVLRRLARGGLLASVRGVQGGYLLARPATDIRVLEVLEALDGPVALVRCLGAGPEACACEERCTTKHHWAAIDAAVRAALGGVRLADLAAPAAPDGPLAPGVLAAARTTPGVPA